MTTSISRRELRSSGVYIMKRESLLLALWRKLTGRGARRRRTYRGPQS